MSLSHSVESDVKVFIIPGAHPECAVRPVPGRQPELVPAEQRQLVLAHHLRVVLELSRAHN